VLVGIIVLFLIVAIIIATEASSWGSIFAKAPGGVANFPQYMADLGGALILGAIAFAGAVVSPTSSPRSPARRRQFRRWGTPSRPTKRTCAAGRAGGR
jgi:hypothetical protein